MPTVNSDDNASIPISPVENSYKQTENDIDKNLPLFLLEIRDLSSSGARRFLHHIDASQILYDAISIAREFLTPSNEDVPNVRSITLILREFDGIAYTTGKDIDFEHKEIHLSTRYVESLSGSAESKERELTGVLVHEVAHVVQWNGRHRCNDGLFEGIAAWVRLKAGLAPSQWKQRCNGCEWDQGGEVTAYFLEWLNECFGRETVVAMNQKLKKTYVQDKFWKGMFVGLNVEDLWEMYTQGIANKTDSDNLSQSRKASNGLKEESRSKN